MSDRFLMQDRIQIAYELASQKTTDNTTDEHLIHSQLRKSIREYAEHPAGGDPTAIGEPHDHERKAENAKHTEIAFAVLTAILAVIFSYLSYYIPLAAAFAILVLVALCGGIAFGLTIALRRGLIWIFEVDGKNKKAVRRLWLLFSASFVVFIVSLIACLLARYAAIGPVDLVGIEQMVVEVSGLLCAAAAGAVQHHYEDIGKLVTKIQRYLRQLGRIESAQEALRAEASGLRLSLPGRNGGALSAKVATPGEEKSLVQTNK